MGVGKTTVGCCSPSGSAAPFRDTDTDIVAAAGKPIAEIFVDEGEPYFRELERQAVADALAEPRRGARARRRRGDRRRDARAAGRTPVVFLEMGVAEAVKRTGLDAPRPLLAVNPRAALAGADGRAPAAVHRVARAVVSTEGRTPQTSLGRAILGRLAPATWAERRRCHAVRQA